MNADPRGEAALLSPPGEDQDPASRDEDVQEAIPAANPPSVLETLRRQAQSGGDPARRKTLVILPERFAGNLAARYMPADWDRIRKEARRRSKRGDTDDVSFMAYQVAMSCEEILIRPEPGSDFIGLGGSMGREPIRFGPELLEILGLLAAGAPAPRPEDAVRVLFRNKEALMAHLAELTAWQREEGDVEDDDEVDPT